MKCYLTVFAAVTMTLVSSAFVPSLNASQGDEKIIVKLTQPLAVEGTLLPAGQYVFKLMGPLSNPNLVSIFSADEKRLITTILATRVYRLQPTDKSEFSFYESRPGRPSALHTWFYRGDSSGFEFQQEQ